MGRLLLKALRNVARALNSVLMVSGALAKIKLSRNQKVVMVKTTTVMVGSMQPAALEKLAILVTQTLVITPLPLY